ncbi:MAG TPA: RidA family protein [Burkholderiales bacterium]|nr:RidA family protein [Burkholderiales bacterium]
MVPIATFSHGLRVGDEIHLGATAGTDAMRRLVGTPRAEADQMFRNMKLAPGLLGGSLEHVVRLKMYFTDWRDMDACEEAYGEHFRSRHPNRTAVASWGFPLPSALIEAELTAVVGSAGVRYSTAGGEDARQALSNLRREVEHARLGLRDVVKLTVTLADLRDHAAFEAVFTDFFRRPYPARTVTAAPLSDARKRFEIESIAIAGGGEPVEARGVVAGPGAASPAMLAGEHLYLSAQTGVDAVGVEAQTRAAWRRIHALVESAGMAPEDVVRTNNWLIDWRSYKEFNTGYADFVQPPYPPRATVIGGILEPGAVVQIEALAHRQGRNATVLETKL